MINKHRCFTEARLLIRFAYKTGGSALYISRLSGPEEEETKIMLI